jgi:hypothetical protein
MSYAKRDIMAHQLAAAAFEQSSERFRASVPAIIFPDELLNVLNIILRERNIEHTSDWGATTILHHRKPKDVGLCQERVPSCLISGRTITYRKTLISPHTVDSRSKSFISIKNLQSCTWTTAARYQQI